MTDVIWVESQADFLDLIETRPDVVVDFTAPSWCRPCQQFAPHFDKAAQTSALSSAPNGRVTFVAVDVDKAPWAMQDYGIRGVPTVARFQDGSRVDDLKARTVVALVNEINS